jgi:hypothetical protein
LPEAREAGGVLLAFSLEHFEALQR